MEQINLSAAEDITEFTDDEHIAVKKINHQFQQKNKLKGIELEFTIFNDIQCYQMTKKKHAGKHKFRINLTYLNPQSERFFSLADNWLITAGVSSILSLLLVYAGWFSNMQLNMTLIPIVTVLTGSFSLIAIMMALLKTNDRVIFYSNHGHAPILELINNKPNKEAFQAFINTLNDQILQAQHFSHLCTTDLLKLELKELRRLKHEKVISEVLYEKAKHRIFKNSAFNADC